MESSLLKLHFKQNKERVILRHLVNFMGYSSTFRFYKYSINLSMNFKQKFTVPFNFFYQTNIPRSDFSLRIFTKS